MNAQDPLANLHPLREPELVSWWPPAPGWWLLSGLLLLSLSALAWFLLRRYRANAYRRQALSQLRAIEQQYLVDQDPGRYVSEVNVLLKSVALVAYPRQEVASHCGEQWLQFLNRSMGAGEQFEPAFATAAYRRECPEVDLAQLQRQAQHWIKSHRSGQ